MQTGRHVLIQYSAFILVLQESMRFVYILRCPTP